MKSFPLLTLNPAEAVFAPFHDPEISTSLDIIAKSNAVGFGWKQTWCGLDVGWEDANPGKIAGEIIVEGRLRRDFYDQFIFCLGTSTEVDVRFLARAGDQWRSVTDWQRGTGKRMEITAPLPEGEITGVSLQVRTNSSGKGNIALAWFGMADASLLPVLARKVVPGDESWDGLIDFPETWPDEPEFWRGLLFDSASLPTLRHKIESPVWKEVFAIVEERARANLSEPPEKWIGDFVPWSDARYRRERERGEPNLFSDALVVGYVGLIRRDRSLALQALRHVMAIVHTVHWCPSAEHRLRGSTWDQRCFSEEVYVTTVALLADWYAWALTPRARSLIAQALWDKGLAVIERDMMKFEYLHHINQGPWFCRARILGGLLLEKAWPRTGSYVDRAHAEMVAGLDSYVLEDGGIDEGAAYFWATMEATFSASFAYARARGREEEAPALLPEKLRRSSDFITALSAMRPGYLLLDGDNNNEQVVGDAPAILAHYFPDQAYSTILAATMAYLKEGYFAPFFGNRVLSFIFGPENLPDPESVVPTFARLPQTGHLTSVRSVEGHTIRLHFAGAKANASHTHFDKGNVTLEIDGVPFLVDRGMLPYEDARHPRLKATALHNVITPMTAEGIFPSQAPITMATIPAGHGDGVELEAAIDLTNVWRERMSECVRKIMSPRPLEFTIEDRGTLRDECRIAFHLQALTPFDVVAKSVRLRGDGIVLEIGGEWVQEVRQCEDLVDYSGRPVWHLILISSPRTEFNLQTRFNIRFTNEGPISEL